MSSNCNIPHPLKREGTYQFERFPAPLEDGYIDIDERKLTDLLKQSAEFARFVNYYNAQNIHDGNWTAFFEEIYDYDTKTLKFTDIAELEAKSNTSPHLALFIAFLELLGIAQTNLNSLKQRHLDFYYKTMLRLTSLAEVPDKIAVSFELDKNNTSAFVPEGTALVAGKDDTGKDVFFLTDEDIEVNNASLTEVRTLFVKKDSDGSPLDVYTSYNAPIDNIVDPDHGSPAWYPFGGNKNVGKAAIGFAIASPMFNLSEGKRRISLQFSNFRGVDRSVLMATYTGPKGWVNIPIEHLVASRSPQANTSEEASDYLLMQLRPVDPPMVPYNAALHNTLQPPGRFFSTAHPVIQVTIRTDDEKKFRDTYTILKKIHASNIKIVVNVTGVQNLIIQNDAGKLDATKTFLPFGSQPSKGKSELYIGHYAAFNKYLFSFHLSINWNGLPGNMQQYYNGYGYFDPPIVHPPAPDYPVIDHNHIYDVGYVDIRRFIPRLPLVQLRHNARANKFMNQWLTRFEEGHPPGDLYILDHGTWKLITLNKNTRYLNRGRKHKERTTNTYKNYIPVSTAYEYGAPRVFAPTTSWGFIKIQLGYDFGHTIYPKLLHTIAIDKVMAKDQQTPIVLPNAPYTPSFKSLHLDYVCVGYLDFKDPDEHQLFHLSPFGSEKITTNKSRLVPDILCEGTLYLGLSGISVAEQVNIYFQFKEGTGNPDKPLTADNKVSWSYLSGNAWQLLDENAYIVKNTTYGFTTSGIIKFKIPKDAISAHTILTDGLTWLKACAPQDSDIYPYLLGINPQVIRATYNNRGNDPMRLAVPLSPLSVTKLQTKIQGIKSVTQPYSSYDGHIAERQEDFYTRVSERLRHKGRAWSIWDYERIVLQQYPAVYKIKCISHSDSGSEYVPGDVLIVVLPNPENVNYQDLLQPKVSRSILDAVKTGIGKYTSPFAIVNVMNPVYEPLKVSCDVRISDGFDEFYYREQLKQELTQFLAPWSVIDTINHHEKISFEGRIFTSQIIDFIERREYVDFVTRVDVYKLMTKFVKCDEVITASNEHSILTSVTPELHEVKTSAIC